MKGQGGADPDRRIKPECATEEKLGRRGLARGIRDDETGNDEEYFNAYPAEPREGRGGRELHVGGDVMLKPWRDARYRRPGPGPERQVKNSDAESSPRAQQIQQ